jgi:hypothetical protein
MANFQKSQRHQDTSATPQISPEVQVQLGTRKFRYLIDRRSEQTVISKMCVCDLPALPLAIEDKDVLYFFWRKKIEKPDVDTGWS